jgi:hypothetical protein
MKLNFSKSIRRFRVKSLPLLAGLILSPLVVIAAGSGYTNTTTIIYVPGYSGNTVRSIQVDATNFVNFGTWEIYTYPAPYHTANTLNYINEGAMYGWVGWDFALYPSTTGQRGMSASFFNDISGVIQASDLSIPNPENSQYPSPVSWLWISATNIVNKGQLIGDGGGEIRLTGSYVNLARGTLAIDPFARGSSIIYGGTNFYPATAIYDEYWGQTNTRPNSTAPYTLNSSNIWDGTTVLSPTFHVNEPCESVMDEQIGFPASLADSISITNLLTGMTNITYTNSSGSPVPTNYPVQIFRQAVFVAVADPNITAADSFLPTGNISNLFQTVTVRLTSASDTLYLVDTLASLTNRGLLLNIGTTPGDNPLTYCTDPTYRPANYNLEGVDPLFVNGVQGAGPPAANFLYDPVMLGFTNPIVQATYAGYSAYVDNLVRRRYGSTVTNWQGRIIINADSLDLTKTTIDNQNGSEVTIQANHLISGAGAVVSCRNLSYNLGSTNGNLNVTNLVGTSVSTLFHGTIDAFSALWTNGYPVIIPNYVTNTTDGGWTPAPFTNFVEVDLHVLLVDATSLSTTEPVIVQDLILHSTNMLNGSVTVARTLLFDGPNLTLQGNLTLSGDLQNWTYANAPNLRYFTNNGVLIIPQDAHFGSDTIYTNAPAIAATATLLEGNPSENVPTNSGVSIGTYTYTFVDTITNTAPNQVKIAATFDGSMSNLIAAINHAAGSGTSYSTNTTANTLVTAGLLTNFTYMALTSRSFTVTAITNGSSGNLIAVTSSAWLLQWMQGDGGFYLSTTLSGGVDAVTNVVMAGGPYAAFVNNGTITNGGGMTINSDYFQNSGTLYAPGGVFVTTSTGLVANASIISWGDVDFSGGALELTNATIFAGNSLYFNLTNKLYDAGPSSGNQLYCGNGFDLLSKPTLGDLLGTTITSQALTPPGLNGPEVDHVWAGVNLGAAQIGSPNNVTIGDLVLTDQGTPTSVNDAPLFRFIGASTIAGVTNALYVNNLDLSNLSILLLGGEYDDEIQVDPNLVIYYVNVIGTTPTHLMSVFGGRFVQTGVPAVGYTGNIRSPQLSASTGSGQQFQLTVHGVADQTLVLQASTDLTNWVNICTGTPPFTVTNASSYPARFYRAVTNVTNE